MLVVVMIVVILVQGGNVSGHSFSWAWGDNAIVPPFPQVIHSKTSQWMPQTTDNMEPYVYYVFPHTFILFHLKKALDGFSLS